MEEVDSDVATPGNEFFEIQTPMPMIPAQVEPQGPSSFNSSPDRNEIKWKGKTDKTRYGCNILFTRQTFMTGTLILFSFMVLVFCFVMLATGNSSAFYTGTITFILGVFVPSPRMDTKKSVSNSPV